MLHHTDAHIKAKSETIITFPLPVTAYEHT